MDAKFVKDVQAKGWSVQAVSQDSVVAKCPSAGCNLFAELKYGGHVPAVDPGCRRDPLDVQVATYDDIRRQLRNAREGLLLTIREVEEISGIASDHLAKVEKDQNPRMPPAQMLFDWAGALGYEVVLRPIPLPALAIRTIMDTRDKTAARTKRMTLESRRRAGKSPRGA
jgi:transcriptional regulator with XRE-family HTH domain